MKAFQTNVLTAVIVDSRNNKKGLSVFETHETRDDALDLLTLIYAPREGEELPTESSSAISEAKIVFA